MSITGGSTNSNIEISPNLISPKGFTNQIEQMVSERNTTYVEAIVEFCTKNDIEIDAVKSLVSQSIKDKLEYEFTELKYFKQTARLPGF